MNVMTKAEFARECNVSRAAISKACISGRLRYALHNDRIIVDHPDAVAYRARCGRSGGRNAAKRNREFEDFIISRSKLARELVEILPARYAERAKKIQMHLFWLAFNSKVILSAQREKMMQLIEAELNRLSKLGN